MAGTPGSKQQTPILFACLNIDLTITTLSPFHTYCHINLLFLDLWIMSELYIKWGNDISINFFQTMMVGYKFFIILFLPWFIYTHKYLFVHVIFNAIMLYFSYIAKHIKHFLPK